MDNKQKQQPELSKEQAELAKERMEQGLCPSCGLSMPWVCRGPLEHLKTGKK